MAAKIMNSQEVLLSLKKLLNTLNCSTLDTEYLTYFTNKNAPKNSLPLVFPTQQDLTAPHFTQWDLCSAGTTSFGRSPKRPRALEPNRLVINSKEELMGFRPSVFY
jgi:hypothetical protein